MTTSPEKDAIHLFYTRQGGTRKLTFSKENYELRKKDFLNRIEAVIHYASSASKCRSQILLEYFGEKESLRCGICDVCRNRNQLGLSKTEFDTWLGVIREELKTPQLQEDLLFKLGPDNEQIRQVLRWLTDNLKVVRRIDNKLEWNSEQ